MKQPTAEQQPGLSFLQMLQSTLWAAIGVQKAANRKRDFTQGNWIHFVLMGIGFTTCFVLAIIGLVQTILA